MIVKKVWGREIWLVNEPEYCAKFLEISKGASGSLHYHPLKKETFIVRKGKLDIEVGSERFFMNTESKPLTISPYTPHRMTGLTDVVILEISTHHDDNDVVRLEESKA